jgi:hypothetical protein
VIILTVIFVTQLQLLIIPIFCSAASATQLWATPQSQVGFVFWLGCEYRLKEWVWYCGVRYDIWLWIQTDGVSGKAVRCSLRFGCEYRLPERVGQVWGEVSGWGENTDRRLVCGQLLDLVSYFVVNTNWRSNSDIFGEVWDLVANKYWRKEWDSCGVRL